MTGPTLGRLLEESANRHDPGPPPYDAIAARSAEQRRRRNVLAVGSAAAALLLATGLGVVTQDDSDDPAPTAGGSRLDLPTQPIPAAIMGAPLSGRLSLDDRECVVLDDDFPFVPVWPTGYTATLDRGQLTIFAPDGTPFAHEGDVVTGYGGYSQPDRPSRCTEGAETGVLQSSIEVVPATPIDLPTSDWEPGSGGDGALAEGTLALLDGCPVLAPPEKGPATQVVWPRGWTATREGDQRLTLRDPEGKVVANEGDTISVGGGFVDGAAHRGCLQAGTREAFFVQSDVEVRE